MKPIVKWAGGKNQLLTRLIERMPEKYNSYYEPFLGGGALLLSVNPENAVVNDINYELIHLYQTVRDSCDDLVLCLSNLDREHELGYKDFYYKQRDIYNQKIIDKVYDLDMAALFIYLNKHCFNGLYRVNSKGLFNVPFNKKKKGQSFDELNLREVSKYLKTIKICNGDFTDILMDVGEEDFVFFDSPYAPLNPTSFEAYTKAGFSKDDHIRLSKVFKDLTNKGVFCMLTNHNTELIRELYSEYNYEVVDVKRMINSDSKNRNGKEVIVTNFSISDYD